MYIEEIQRFLKYILMILCIYMYIQIYDYVHLDLDPPLKGVFHLLLTSNF